MTSPSTITERVAEMHATMAGTERPPRCLVAVSPQKPDGSLTMQQKNNLAFTVVSDPGNTIADRLGILTRPSQEARAAQLQLGLDLADVNADGTDTLPMPATATRLRHPHRAPPGHRRPRPPERLTIDR